MARSLALTATSLAAILDIEPSPRPRGMLFAAIQDARHVNSRAASIWVASSASGKAMPWLSMIGPPNASRWVAYVVAYSSAARDADRLGRNHRTGLLEGAQRRRARTFPAGYRLS